MQRATAASAAAAAAAPTPARAAPCHGCRRVVARYIRCDGGASGETYNQGVRHVWCDVCLYAHQGLRLDDLVRAPHLWRKCVACSLDCVCPRCEQQYQDYHRGQDALLGKRRRRDKNGDDWWACATGTVRLRSHGTQTFDTGDVPDMLVAADNDATTAAAAAAVIVGGGGDSERVVSAVAPSVSDAATGVDKVPAVDKDKENDEKKGKDKKAAAKAQRPRRMFERPSKRTPVAVTKAAFMRGLAEKRREREAADAAEAAAEAAAAAAAAAGAAGAATVGH